MDKHACRQLAMNGYKNGQWPESYITWEFLADHPGPWNPGISILTGTVYPDCTSVNPI